MRPSKKEYYLMIAKTIALRSPCLRRKFGAVIVRDDSIVSTGYNGPARGELHCETCYRDEHNLDPLSDYQGCPAVHAEENAIINAAREGMSVKGGVIYIAGIDVKTELPFTMKPCYRCSRALINAGIGETIITL